MVPVERKPDTRSLFLNRLTFLIVPISFIRRYAACSGVSASTSTSWLICCDCDESSLSMSDAFFRGILVTLFCPVPTLYADSLSAAAALSRIVFPEIFFFK